MPDEELPRAFHHASLLIGVSRLASVAGRVSGRLSVVRPVMVA